MKIAKDPEFVNAVYQRYMVACSRKEKREKELLKRQSMSSLHSSAESSDDFDGDLVVKQLLDSLKEKLARITAQLRLKQMHDEREEVVNSINVTKI